MSKTVNRGWLLRMALAGRLWMRCRYHYTDDYAGDAASNFGKMNDFAQVFIKPECKLPEGSENWDYNQESWYRSEFYSQWRNENKLGYIGHENKMEGHADDYRGHGRAYCDGDKNKGTFRVHSNLVYDYEVR